MKFRIGELAKLFSITKEGIRYYEKANILKPSRDEENGYRYYDELDFQKLGAIRKLQNINFTLDEVRDIYYKEDKDGVLNTYKQKLKQIQDEIYIKQKIAEKLDEQIEIIDNVDNLVKEYKEVHIEGYYRLNIGTMNELIKLKDTEDISKWFKNMFIVNASSKVKFNNKIEILNKGLVIEKDIGDKILIDVNSSSEIETIDSGLYLRTVIKIVDGEYDFAFINKTIKKYTKETGNKIGEGFSKVVFSYVNDKGKPMVYSELFLKVLKE